MIITVANKETAIRANIRQTLEQIKQSGTPNQPLVFKHALAATGWDSLSETQLENMDEPTLESLGIDASELAVSFYTDAAKTNLLFTETYATTPSSFKFATTAVFYTPPDAKINAATGPSSTMAQATYYVTASFGDGTTINTTYSNQQNMMFQQVVVASKQDAKYLTERTACIVPSGERVDNFKGSDDISYVILTYNLLIPLSQFQDNVGLSEESKFALADTWLGAVRNALYQDRYRNGICTFYDKNLDGTFVGRYELVEKLGAIRIPIQCVYMTNSTGY